MATPNEDARLWHVIPTAADREMELECRKLAGHKTRAATIRAALKSYRRGLRSKKSRAEKREQGSTPAANEQGSR